VQTFSRGRAPDTDSAVLAVVVCDLRREELSAEQIDAWVTYIATIRKISHYFNLLLSEQHSTQHYEERVQQEL